MPYVSTRTVRTVKYSGGGQPEVTSVTTSIDRDGNRTVSSHGGGAPNGDPAPAGGGSSRYQTPRSAALKPSVAVSGPQAPHGGSASSAKPEGRGGKPSTGPSADFTAMQSDAARSGRLFEDPDFPATDSSLFYSRSPPRRFEWMRPHEICNNPEFISDGASRFDVRQGELGDCWLLAAVACLSLHSELFEQVVPSNQSLVRGGPGYAGVVRFRFWRFGEWKEVVVDDRLPVYNGRLVFMHSNETNEFWSALLEKAYAKLCGSYEALKGGSTSEALEDFTGGVTELFDLNKDVSSGLFGIMSQAFRRCSLMGCSIEADPNRTEAELANGLIMGHAYSITDVRALPISIPGGKAGTVQLVRVRNPWGNEAEWKGSWSDKSPEWQYIPASDREQINIEFRDDGEFWMSFQDFVKNFEKLEICHLGPQSLEADQLGGQPKTRWEMCMENGEWKKRLNAGGCRNFLDTFWTNPQFRVSVVDSDEGDNEDMGTLIIGLMQKDMRKRRKEGVDMFTIGYAIYKLQSKGQGPLDVNFFKFNASVARSPSFINTREVCGRHRLAPGDYVIVPSTFEPNQEALFILRLFSENPNSSGEIDEQTGMSPPEHAEATKTVQNVPEKVLSTKDDSKMAALRDTFTKVAGEDLEIDAYELQAILNAAFKRGADGQYFKFDGFSIETSKSMVAMMDYDQSGKLGFDEFTVLWTSLYLWKAAFKKHDQDKSGNMNSYELRLALNASGFRLSNKIFNSLVMRFADKQGLIAFDDYVLCCVRLKTIFETFKSQEQDKNGRAVFDQDTFIQCIMYV